MSNPGLPEDQLIELLLQLKRTTPKQARDILSSQPPISYALIALMVKLDALDVDVVQKTVAAFGAQQNLPAVPPPQLPTASAPISAPAPASAIPPHLAHGYHARTPTPQSHSATPVPVPAPAYPQYPYPAAPSAPPVPHAGAIPDVLSVIPEEHKAMIMRVLAMSPEQLERLPPQERARIMQLRATLGIPSG